MNKLFDCYKNITKDSYRYLLGFRVVTESNWDWESAVTYSKAASNDISNRIVYQNLYQHLAGDISKTPAAFNIFDVKGFHLDLEQAGVRQESIYKWRTRRVFITVSYKFGNIDSKLKALKSSGGGDGAD